MTSVMSDRGKLAGRVAVITGSTEGIGFAMAKRLAQDGAKVMISSRNRDNVDKAVDALKMYDVAGTTCHVGNKDDRARLIKETIDKFGGIDILILNAAVNPVFGVRTLETPEEAWDKIFDINLKVPFLFIKDVVPHMKERGGGSILTVSSIVGFHASDRMGAYATSKTALLGLVKAFVPELARLNIRINGVAPGLVETNFSKKIMTYDNNRLMKFAMSHLPLQRMAQSDDISGAASFLVSDDARYITGENLVVAGGMMSRL